jgi:hypothetical protein
MSRQRNRVIWSVHGKPEEWYLLRWQIEGPGRWMMRGSGICLMFASGGRKEETGAMEWWSDGVMVVETWSLLG